LAINQAYLFLIFTLNGVWIGLFFDFFRILRKSFKTINLITYIEDILFWILTGISIIFCMYHFSDGSLRFFMFLGLLFGFVLYLLTLSKIIIKTVVSLITILKKITHKILKIIIIPLRFLYTMVDKILFRPIYLFSIKTQSFLTKKSKKISGKIKNLKKM